MKELDLGNGDIGKLIKQFSIPCIISMLINSIYNIVDQIFIGKGVGTLGNAATNVIFPLVILGTAVACLIGNGSAANLSLKLGQNDKEGAKKSVGSSITLLIISSILLTIICYIFLPKLVILFGCSESVLDYALSYGRIIVLGFPAVITYTALASIIRSDNDPSYSMKLLVIGAIINIVLDPLFIFVFKMGVVGGALATIIGQVVSAIMAIKYIIFNMKSFKLTKKDLRIDKSIYKTLALGTSSFITNITILFLSVTINNLMNKYGANSIYGANIPLSVSGIVNKINSIYISILLGLYIGAQPIIGFNYGARNYTRVKETIKKVLSVGVVIAIIYNLIILLFPNVLVSMFISPNEENYNLFIEFGVKYFRTFLAICFLYSFEIMTSILSQSLGNVKKSMLISVVRQVVLLIPISIILSRIYGIMGVLYAGPISDFITFFVVLIAFSLEYKKLTKLEKEFKIEEENKVISKNKLKSKVIITISREYGSGGRYVGKLLANNLGIKFYDKEIINKTASKSGLDSSFIEKEEQTNHNTTYSFYSNDDKIFISESKVIKDLSKESCVIIGRCADYILKDKAYKVFLYSNSNSKVKRATKYYGLDKKNTLKEINRINKLRAKHYKYYTEQDWDNFNNYDIAINVDVLGVEKTSELLQNIIINNYK